MALLRDRRKNQHRIYFPRLDKCICFVLTNNLSMLPDFFWINDFIPFPSQRFLKEGNSIDHKPIFSRKNRGIKLRAELIKTKPHKVIGRSYTKKMPSFLNHLHAVCNCSWEIKNMLKRTTVSNK